MKLQNKIKYTAFVQLYGLLNIPLLVFIGPRVEEFNDRQCIIKIPLGYRTKNHLHSMYFGSLAVGAELSVAAAAVFAIQQSKQKIDFVFKDFQMKFAKRADGDVHFVCNEVAHVTEMIEKSKSTDERIERKFKGFAIVPSKSQEPVAEYELTLSVRNRSRGK